MKKQLNVMKARNVLITFRIFLLSIILSSFSLAGWGQTPETGNQSPQKIIEVTGRVIDNIGEPIVGANIAIKGTTTGTISDVDGNFSLKAPIGEELHISFIGFSSQIILARENPINVIMEDELSLLDDVVVIGYGTVKKRDLTGAVTSIKSPDVTVNPTTNVMEALQGKVAGMDIVKTSGQIGEDVQILLRGSRSIYGDNTPLFIIDGIIGSYNQINPSDIESIDVLKDASSTAIYGSAGSNGVVIITTKRGEEGKTTVNLDSYFGFSGSPKFLHGMTGDEWTTYQQETYKYVNGNYPANMSAILTNNSMLEAYNNNKWIDWVEESAGNTATTQKYSLSITGGTKNTKVYSAISYNKEEGLLSNEGMDKYSLRLNIDHEIMAWVKAGFTSNLTFQDRDRGVKNTFTKSLSVFPLGDAYDENGYINHEYIEDQYSPLGDFIKDQYVDNTKSTYINSSAFLEVLPVKGVSLKSTISATLDNSRRGRFLGAKCNANRPSYSGTPYAEITNSYGYSYTWENVLSYSETIGYDHRIGATLVSSWSKEQDESNMNTGSGQELDSWSFYRLNSATSQYITSDFAQKQKMSYAVRFNYSYKGKYLLSLSNRWDGVSWLSEGHKWDSFTAGALAWRISDEGFMESTQNWLNNLKLRVGYGVTGNSGGVGAYGTQTNAITYSSAGVSINGTIIPFTQYTGTFGNPGLGWEKSYNLNIGLDFSVLNNKIDGSIEWFNTQTEDLLFKRKLPITSGATGWGSPLNRWENIASTSNTGIEFTINSHNIKRSYFTWDTSLSFSWSKEKIESLPSGNLIAESLFEGYSINSLYNYKYEGIWGTNTTTETLDAYGVKAGWVKINTVEQFDDQMISDGGVHKYSEKDKQILGHTSPDYIFGLNNSFTYKNFDLSVFVMARYGQTIKSDLIGWYTASQSATINQPSGIDYWTENNQGAYFPAAGSGNKQTVMSALTYRDGSFIKVKNITLGYSIPKQIIKKALMEKCRLYVTAYNPFLYVKDKQLKDTDPETNGSDSFPLYKQFVFGVIITF